MDKKILIFILLTAVVLSTFLTGCSQNNIEPTITPSINNPVQNVEPIEKGSFERKTYSGQSYTVLSEDYNGIYKEEYKGEYDFQQVSFPENGGNFNETSTVTYAGYKEFCETWGLQQKYTNENSRYAIVAYGNTWVNKIDVMVSNIEIENDVAIVVMTEDLDYKKDVYEEKTFVGYFIAFPVDEGIAVDTSLIMSETDYWDMYFSHQTTVDKPIIYFYPTETVNVSVKLVNDELITHSYPKYTNGWNVIAHPDGTLQDITTGRELYSLYYECNPARDITMQNEGFVIEGKDTISFLEEKLSILGLTEREAEEFIIYWLPKMENNKYNYIRFATAEEIEQTMPLEFSVKPNTIIRVWMEFKALDEEIQITEQVLTTPQRTGFTVVEWGGSEIQ